MTKNDKELSQHKSDTSGLSTGKEKLLCAFHDRECGFFSSCYVKFLVKKSGEARAFLSSLRFQSSSIKKSPPESIPGCSDSELWKRIEARIHQEEYAARFQGSRISAEKRSLLRRFGFQNFTGNTMLWGGASGALVAATIMLTVLSNAPKGDRAAANQMASASPEKTETTSALNLQPVRFQETGKQRPIITERGFNAPSAIEVDWMRGNGPVRVVENPEERSALIWVTKRTTPKPLYSAPYFTEKRLPQVYSAGNIR